MADLMLRPGLAVCSIDGMAVFLDLGADRYFQINRAASELLMEALEGRHEREAASKFIALGILVEGTSTQGAAILSRPKPEVALMPDNEGHIPRRWIAIAAVFLTLARWKQMVRPVRLLGEGLHKRWWRIRPTKGGDDNMAALVAAYDQANRLVPLNTNCVSRSHALRAFLAAAAGLQSEVVIGVKLRPFAAHCWLEQEGRLVGDRLDYVDAFTPIAVVA